MISWIYVERAKSLSYCMADIYVRHSNFCISLAVNMRGIRLAIFLAMVLLQANMQVRNAILIASAYLV